MDKNKQALKSIKLVTSEINTGISGNINMDLKNANREYIKLIVADDYMTPDAISEYVNFVSLIPKQ